MSVHAGVTRAASAGITRAQTEPSVLELAVSSAAETRSEEGPAPKLEHVRNGSGSLSLSARRLHSLSPPLAWNPRRSLPLAQLYSREEDRRLASLYV